MRAALIWAVLGAAMLVPLAIAAASPLLQWRDPVYIAAGFAGVAAMALLLLQPFLAVGDLPGLSRPASRRVHRWSGAVLVGAVLIHVSGLAVTSPPDVIDALLFVSPTPFAVWGVIAMWALFAAALMGAFRRGLPLPPRAWRLGHSALVATVVAGTILHALLIEGTMGPLSKAVLALMTAAALIRAFVALRTWVLLAKRGVE